MSNVKQLVPTGFTRICTESRAGLAVTIVLLGLGVIGLVVAGLSWATEHKIQRLRGEREVMASRDGSDALDHFGGMPYEKTGRQV